MNDDDFEALKARVARLAAETAEATVQLLGELTRRDQLAGIEARGPATVTPILRPGPGNS